MFLERSKSVHHYNTVMLGMMGGALYANIN